MSKRELEEGISHAYKMRSIPLLKGIRMRALETREYKTAERAVKCINSLQNPFSFYC